MTEHRSAEADALYKKAVVADFTAPGSPNGRLISSEAATEAWISGYEDAGCSWVSFTVAADHYTNGIDTCITSIAKARHWFLARPDRFILATSANDVLRAKKQNKMAVSLHFQGTLPFQRDIRLVELYKRLGVIHALMAYNTKNFVGDGCHERTDAGLSRFGVELIQEMNRVGMIVDVSHTGHRTAMETIETSTAPVIMSHASPKAVFNHPRNVPDDQIAAMAASGGVMGVHGVGIFMTEEGNDVSAARICDFIRYAVDLVGPGHVGLGLDEIWRGAVPALMQGIRDAGSTYSEDGGYRNDDIHFAPPAVIPDIAEILLRDNYTEDAVLGILGGNWLRVLSEVNGE